MQADYLINHLFTQYEGGKLSRYLIPRFPFRGNMLAIINLQKDIGESYTNNNKDFKLGSNPLLDLAGLTYEGKVVWGRYLNYNTYKSLEIPSYNSNIQSTLYHNNLVHLWYFLLAPARQNSKLAQLINKSLSQEFHSLLNRAKRNQVYEGSMILCNMTVIDNFLPIIELVLEAFKIKPHTTIRLEKAIKIHKQLLSIFDQFLNMYLPDRYTNFIEHVSAVKPILLFTKDDQEIKTTRFEIIVPLYWNKPMNCFDVLIENQLVSENCNGEPFLEDDDKEKSDIDNEEELEEEDEKNSNDDDKEKSDTDKEEESEEEDEKNFNDDDKEKSDTDKEEESEEENSDMNIEKDMEPLVLYIDDDEDLEDEVLCILSNADWIKIENDNDYLKKL